MKVSKTLIQGMGKRSEVQRPCCPHLLDRACIYSCASVFRSSCLLTCFPLLSLAIIASRRMVDWMQSSRGTAAIFAIFLLLATTLALLGPIVLKIVRRRHKALSGALEVLHDPANAQFEFVDIAHLCRSFASHVMLTSFSLQDRCCPWPWCRFRIHLDPSSPRVLNRQEAGPQCHVT